MAESLITRKGSKVTVTNTAIPILIDDTDYGTRTEYGPVLDMTTPRKVVGGSVGRHRMGQTGSVGEIIYIQGSNDNSTYTTLFQQTLPNGASYENERGGYAFSGEIATTYRYFRIRYDVVWQGTGGHELAFWGTITTLQ